MSPVAVRRGHSQVIEIVTVAVPVAVPVAVRRGSCKSLKYLPSRCRRGVRANPPYYPPRAGAPSWGGDTALFCRQGRIR